MPSNKALFRLSVSNVKLNYDYNDLFRTKSFACVLHLLFSPWQDPFYFHFCSCTSRSWQINTSVNDTFYYNRC